jgi:hypothetical protein
MGVLEMNYEEMSDFEINKLVANKLGLFWHVKPENNDYDHKWEFSDNYEQCDTENGDVAIELPNYCNKAEHAWPIILGNKISIDFCKEEGVETSTGIRWERCGNETNPLRSAMITFLRIGEGKWNA